MELALVNLLFSGKARNKKIKAVKQQNLTHAEVNHPYVIKGIDTEEKSMKDFLFTLGCFEGEKITVISVLAENYIINVKDARYCIDQDLAKAILI
jgi:Fe2+ transport system protein FeoA